MHPDHRPTIPTLRRRLATGTALLLACVAVAGCGSDGTDDAPAGAAADGFRYTDGRSRTVDLPRVPRRIVASEQAAAALIPYGIVPVGVWGNGEPKDSVPLAGLPVDGIESVGQEYGEIDLERVAALKPDLIITGAYPGDFLGGLGAADSDVARTIAKIAPMIAVSAKLTASEQIAEYREVAGLLRADTDGDAIAAQRRTYEQAVGGLKAAIRRKPELTALATSPSSEFYVATTGEFPELRDYARWGLKLVESDVPRTAKSGGFAPVSWENTSDFDPDLILFDTRPYAFPLEKIEATRPTWRSIPAARAGRLVDWTTDATSNYASYTKQIRELTQAIERTPTD